MAPKELLFSGENRRSSLNQLKRIYDDVAAYAEAAANGKRIDGPSHRVVLLEAERGLGKTRMAMELYLHLTKACDPEHYWPDTYGRQKEQVHVMPGADGFRDYGRSFPFLWWGIGISHGANVGTTINGAIADLLPHLVSARLAARRRKTGRTVTAELLDLGVDLGLPVAEGALDLIGLGLVKSIGQAAFKIGAAVREHSTDQGDAYEQARVQLDSLSQAVLDDLSGLFRPSSKQYAGVPLILFVDDAQFADDDTAVAEFVERLIARASAENWPVLVILTHWSRQMNEWVDAKGRRHLPSRIARVLHHAQDGRPSEPGPFAKMPGGGLPQEAFIRLDLSEPVDDLSDALRDRFPGIVDEDVAAIINHATGNPRKLEQIMLEMEEEPRWFDKPKDWPRERPATDAPLTDIGREKILALAKLDILGVVMERFKDTSAEARRALMVAALMGNRFVCDLVDKLAQAQNIGAARQGLVSGEANYRLLRGIVDRSRNDIGEFREQLFLEAANKYREKGLAAEQLDDWPEDKNLLGALDSLLSDLVQEPDSFGGLKSDDFAEAYGLAVKRMVSAENSAAGLALARLVELENGRGNPEGAYAAAQAFIDGLEE